MADIKQTGREYNLYSWSAQGSIDPINIVKAEGIYFWDEDGNRYYDMSSQLVNANLGHGNKKIVAAIKEQSDKIPFIGPAYSCDVRSEAAKKVVEISGMEKAKVFFTNAGAESNENAIKMAKAYTGKWKVLSMYRSYHGSTFGASSLTGDLRRLIAEPGVPGFVKFDGPYTYRAPRQTRLKTEEDISDFYLGLLENQILYEGPDHIAALFLETIVGSNGVLIPPRGYLAGVRKICSKYDIVMVCDEVMTGFGRAGKWFAFQNWAIQPDLVTFAKGVTCGYVQLGGVIVSEKIAKFFDDQKMYCGLTYSAHPLGCAAAIAAINEYQDLKIFENVNKQGVLLGGLLENILKTHPCVGEVRYKGLLGAIELVKSKKTKEPMVPFGSDETGIMVKIIGMLKSEGFSTYSHENVLIVAPPLIITEEELKSAMDILDRILDSVDNML